MSQRDLPMWARGAAAALLLVASWWLVHTETIRSAVGDSVGVLSLGVLAGSILRGMHLPLGFWPEGPWRPRMVLAVVVVVGVVGSGLLLFAWPATSQALSARVDPGTYVLVVTGVVATGIVIGLVRQRTYLRWFGVALLMAAVPYATGAVVAGAPWPLRCVQVIEAAGGSASCDASILRMIAFALPVYGAGGLLTTELAFRRMLLGRRHGAGVALVAASAVVVALWWALAAGETPSVVDTLLVGGVGGAIAGSLYAVSGSLLVSGAYWALLMAVEQVVGAPAAPPGGVTTWQVTHAAVGAALLFLVLRRNGIVGDISTEDVEPEEDGAEEDGAARN